MGLRTALMIGLALTAGSSARAALVLEYSHVNGINAQLSNGPALTALLMTPGETTFVQVALRDTGSGINWLNWGAPVSYGLGAYFLRFDGIPGVAVNPSPTFPGNARMVDPVTYAMVTAGTSPPTFTRVGGLVNLGSEPGLIPTIQDRIGLFNLRITALGAGSGSFRLRDPNPAATMVDNALLGNDAFGTFLTIDDLLFGPAFTNTFDLPVTVVPEPSSLALVLLASGGHYARRQAARRGKPGGSLTNAGG